MDADDDEILIGDERPYDMDNYAQSTTATDSKGGDNTTEPRPQHTTHTQHPKSPYRRAEMPSNDSSGSGSDSSQEWHNDMNDLSWNVPPVPMESDSEDSAAQNQSGSPSRRHADIGNGHTVDDSVDAHNDGDASYIDQHTDYVAELNEPSVEESGNPLSTPHKRTQRSSFVSFSDITADLESTRILSELELLEAENEDLDRSNSIDVEAETGDLDKLLKSGREINVRLKRSEKAIMREKEKAKQLNTQHRPTSSRATNKRKGSYDRRHSYMRGPLTPRRMADRSWIDSENGSLAVRSRTETLEDMSDEEDGTDMANILRDESMESVEGDNNDDSAESGSTSDKNATNDLPHRQGSPEGEEPAETQDHSQSIQGGNANSPSPSSPTHASGPGESAPMQESHTDSQLVDELDTHLHQATPSTSANDLQAHIKQEPSLSDAEQPSHSNTQGVQPINSRDSMMSQTSPAIGNAHILRAPHPLQAQTNNRNRRQDTSNDDSHDTSNSSNHDISQKSLDNSLSHPITNDKIEQLNMTDLLRHVGHVFGPNNEAIVEIHSSDPGTVARATNFLQLLNREIETGINAQLTYEEKMEKAKRVVKRSMPQVYDLYAQRMRDLPSAPTGPSSPQQRARQTTRTPSSQLPRIPRATSSTSQLTPEWGRSNWLALESIYDGCRKRGVKDIKTIVNEFLDAWQIDHRSATGEMHPEKMANRVFALGAKEAERRRRRRQRRTKTRSQRSGSRGTSMVTSRATFSPSESLMNADYSRAPSYTPIYPQNMLLSPEGENSKTPLMKQDEAKKTPSTLEKFFNFGAFPIMGLMRSRKPLKPVSENEDEELSRSRSVSSTRSVSSSGNQSFGNQSMDSSMSSHTGASIWTEKKHKARGIPKRRLHDGLIAGEVHHNVRSMQDGESRQSDTHENKRRRQSPRRSISRRLSNTSQRSSLRNDVTSHMLENDVQEGTSLV